MDFWQVCLHVIYQPSFHSPSAPFSPLLFPHSLLPLLPLSFPLSLPLSPNRLDVGLAHLLPLLGDVSTFIYFLCLELFLLLSAFAVYPLFMVGH